MRWALPFNNTISAVPSIEFAKRIADALGMLLDYLVGEGINASFDKKHYSVYRI
jgi:hypothetical protein